MRAVAARRAREGDRGRRRRREAAPPRREARRRPGRVEEPLSQGCASPEAGGLAGRRRFGTDAPRRRRGRTWLRPSAPPRRSSSSRPRTRATPGHSPTRRRRLGRPLTFAEKVLFAHADDPATVGLDRGVDYADYRPDRVAMQDATAQMALLQFMLAGLPTVAVPTTVHCDHLIQARVGADVDLATRSTSNSEVYEFLRIGVGEVRHRLLEAGLRDHPPGRARAVRVPGRDDDRHRHAHAQRRRARHGRDRRRRCRRGRRDGRLAVQHPRARSSSACT